MGKELSSILCVDDDPDIVEIVRLSLNTVGGLKVTTASSGQECLNMVSDVAPDLILLDVMMPGMDGPSTLAALRASPNTAGIPLVFMTARVQPEEVKEYLAQGALGVISKPFDPMTLADELRALWGSAHGP